MDQVVRNILQQLRKKFNIIVVLSFHIPDTFCQRTIVKRLDQRNAANIFFKTHVHNCCSIKFLSSYVLLAVFLREIVISQKTNATT